MTHCVGASDEVGPDWVGYLIAAEAKSKRLIRTARRMAAGAGVALLLILGLIQETSGSDRIAFVALVALVMATVLAGWEVVVGRREHAQSPVTDPAVSVSAWITTAGFTAVGSILVVQAWFRGGSSIAGGDIGPPDGVAWLGRLFAPWVWSGSDLGSPGTLELQLPWAAVLGLVNYAGGSAALAQRIWYTALFTGAAVGALVLLKTFGAKPVPAAIGAAVFVLNPYVITAVGTSPVYLLALALLALLPTCVLAAARSAISVRAAAIWLGLSAPLLGYVFINPPLVGMVLAAVIASPAVAWWLWGVEAVGRALRATLLGLGLLLIASAYWIIPVGIQLHTAAIGNLASASSWAWTEGRATIQNAFWLNTTWAWSSQYFPYASDYLAPPLSLLKFALPAAAFGSLCIAARPSKESDQDSARLGLPIVVAASTVALFLIVFSTGTRPPGKWIFDPLYNLPLGWILREPGRFLMFASLAYAILVTALASHLMSMHASRGRRANFARLPLGPTAAILLGGAISFGPGFPIVVGALVPDARPPLPSSHVQLPNYWTEMATFIDQAPYDGALVVFPPDDFYQMPYRWGYYGTDAFIPFLMKREVLIPNAQGYFPTTDSLMNASSLIASSLLRGDWGQVDNLLQSVGAPLILVRGDINPDFPGRTILSPAALSAALSRAPSFKLLHRAGALALFANLSYVESGLAVAPEFATVDSNSPDLRILSLLTPGTRLVSGTALPGIPRVSQAPQLSTWNLGAGALSVALAEPVGWHYKIGLLNADTPSQVVDPLVAPDRLRPFVAVEGIDQSTGAGILSLRLPLGNSLITNGAFIEGPWQDTVGDCLALGGNSGSPALDATVVGGGPNGLPALRLSASADSACEARAITWDSGPLLVDLQVRHLSGSAPRVCVWETGVGHCAPSIDNVKGIGWAEHALYVTPDAGAASLSLFIYSDADPSATRTVNDYSDVAVYAIPSSNVVLLGYPDGQPTGASKLVVLRASYSDGWIGPKQAKHVLVDGMMNGWLVGQAEPGRSAIYGPATLVSAGQVMSVAAFILIVTLFVTLLLGKDLVIRLRRHGHA